MLLLNTSDNKCRNSNVSNSQTSNRQKDQKFVKDKICLIIKKNKRQIYWLHLSKYMENLLKSYSNFRGQIIKEIERKYGVLDSFSES